MRAIAIRLTIAFMCIILFLAVQGLYTLYSTRFLSEAHQQALNDELSLRQISENLSQARLAVYKILGTMNPQIMDEALDDFNNRIKHLDDHLETLGIAHYLIEENKAVYERIIRLHYDFSVRRARELMDHDSLKLHEALVRALEARSLASVLKVQDQVRNVRTRIITYSAGLGIAALLVAIIWALVLMRSLIDRRAAEFAIASSEANYREIFNNILDVFYRTDLSGNVMIISPSVHKYLGYTSDELIGTKIASLHVDPGGREDFLRDLRENGEVSGYEIRLRAKNGNLVWVSTNAQCFRNAEGKIIGVQGVARDITESKRIEEERKEFEARLQQAQKMEAIGTLAGGIAHDFNNILAAIIGYAELSVYENQEGKKNLEYLRQIIAASTRARDLVQQILTFSRKAPPEKKPTDIASTISESLKFIRASLPTTIEIQLLMESDPGPVMADPTQIQQVVMNLAANAAHAMKENGGVLKVELAQADGVGDRFGSEEGQLVESRLRISVSDTGNGIPPEALDRIFEPFFTTKDVGEGTGMGLAVVHGIVTSHGGEIQVQSEPGCGARFDIYLPLIGSETSETLLKDRRILVGGQESLLLVDDEEAILDVNRDILERLGYSVETCQNGRDAIESVQLNPRAFDLVLTDLSMPIMSGKELARSLSEIRPDMPIILCTGYGDSITPDQAGSLGIKAYLNKPISIDLLARTVRDVLDAAVLEQTETISPSTLSPQI